MTIPTSPIIPQATAATAPAPNPKFNSPELREAFNQFVGETFYGQMLSSMRKTLGKPAYFHGGRAEEIFQAQLDQTIGEHLAKANADELAGPMFKLFSLQRS
jgi:flagellar protein FlgJ